MITGLQKLQKMENQIPSDLLGKMLRELDINIALDKVQDMLL
jgi:hypothetical protein